MARPRLAVPLTEVAQAYRDAGSVRAAARRLGVSRAVVADRLRDLGIAPKDRHEAMAQVRVLTPVKPHKTVVHKTRWGPEGVGCTVISFERRVAYTPCVWPGCDTEADEGHLCSKHHQQVQSAGNGRCAWPSCVQSPTMSGSLCYAHEKRAEGVMA